MSIETVVTQANPPHSYRFALPLEEAIIEGGIIEPLEKAHLLAQIAHESNGFKRLDENLNYSPSALRKTFRKYFTEEEYTKFAYKPIKIANRVYANRMGNGPEGSGDGYKHRGMGLIQLTGKDNQRAYSFAQYGDDRITQEPALLMLPEDAARSAVWFWKINNCGKYARQNNIEAVSGIINAGSPTRIAHGMESRKKWFDRFMRIQQDLIQ